MNIKLVYIVYNLNLGLIILENMNFQFGIMVKYNFIYNYNI